VSRAQRVSPCKIGCLTSLAEPLLAVDVCHRICRLSGCSSSQWLERAAPCTARSRYVITTWSRDSTRIVLRDEEVAVEPRTKKLLLHKHNFLGSVHLSLRPKTYSKCVIYLLPPIPQLLRFAQLWVASLAQHFFHARTSPALQLRQSLRVAHHPKAFFFSFAFCIPHRALLRRSR